MSVATRLLVVEDDAELRGVLVRGLDEEGFSTRAVGTGRDLLESMERDVPDLRIDAIG
jgi:two-component system OmpR family response regulator